MHLTGVPTAFSETPQSITVKRRAAMRKYRGLKKQAHKLRESFGKKLIKARAEEYKTTVEAQEKQLRQTFGQRALAKRVKRLTGAPRATMGYINAPNNNGMQTDHYDRTSIEAACKEEGTRRFSQTNTTPLMQPDFVCWVGYHGELTGADEILNGTFTPEPDMDQYAAQFITQLKMPTVVHNKPLSKAISTESYRKSWSKMKANTLCSP